MQGPEEEQPSMPEEEYRELDAYIAEKEDEESQRRAEQEVAIDEADEQDRAEEKERDEVMAAEQEVWEKIQVQNAALTIITAIVKALTTEYAKQQMPMERPWLTIVEPSWDLGDQKPAWAITHNTPARMERHLDPLVIANGTLVPLAHESPVKLMKVELAQSIPYDGSVWSLAAFKHRFSEEHIPHLPRYEFLVDITWRTDPITLLDFCKEVTDATEGATGGKGGKKGKDGKGKGGRGKGGRGKASSSGIDENS